MDKKEFQKKIVEWLLKYLKDRYSKKYSLKVIVPETNLSKISIEEIKRVPHYSSLEFKPDILGILINKQTGKVELVFLNMNMSTISLKDIGEMHCYSDLAKPEIAFIVSTKGLPGEVNLLLINDIIQKNLLDYDKDKSIIVFGWDTKNNKVDTLSVFPIEKRKYIT
ncbi:MAG: hypothetical protein ABH873_07940 [Candidatus Firestonebacteria bacterium]